MFSKSVTLAQYDPDLAAAIAQEDKRQQDHVELIASETTSAVPLWKPKVRN